MKLPTLTMLAAVLLSCAAAMPAAERAAPRPAVRVRELSRSAPGDTLRYALSWTAGARAVSYGVRVTANSGTWTGLPNGTTVTGLTTTFSAINPTWDSVTFTARVWSVGASGLASRDTATVTWRAYRRPGAPGSVSVDSSQVQAVIIKPDDVTVLAGGTQQFCAFVRLADGYVYGTAGTTSITYCAANYAAWFPLYERLPVLRDARVAPPPALRHPGVRWAYAPTPWARYAA